MVRLIDKRRKAIIVPSDEKSVFLMLNRIHVAILLHLNNTYYFFNNLQSFINMFLFHDQRGPETDGFVAAA